ncbi:MAG: hypothetical protein H7Z75_02495, partial [Ferruginibacter sp.]|nr:hypothetical protein [Cytophagales bacterium]
EPSFVDGVLCLVFAGVAFQNLLLFSWFEAETDRRANESSLAVHWGNDPTRRVLNGLAWVVLLLAGLSFALAPDVRPRAVAAVEGAMGAVLFVISCFPAYFARHKSYRWVGDGVFWLPWVLGGTLWTY